MSTTHAFYLYFLQVMLTTYDADPHYCMEDHVFVRCSRKAPT
jgi:hypothetical protein